MDDSSDSLAARAAAQTEGVGAFLRARRESLGLSYADVGHVVKLSAKRIESLEAERWSELPDGPFLRGFLRNVARALDIDDASLMARVDDSLVRARTPESILVAPGAMRAMLPRRSGPLEDRHGGRMLVYGAILFAIVAAVIAWSGTESFDRTVATGRSLLQFPPPTASTPPVATDAAKAEPAPPTNEALTAANPAASPASNAGEAPPTPAPAATNADTASTAVASASPAAPASPLALLFHFNEECWVEVRDAEGRILLKSLNAAGSERAIEGEAPYSLVVGNAKGVDLHFRGQAVDLVPYTHDQVARLKLS